MRISSVFICLMLVTLSAGGIALDTSPSTLEEEGMLGDVNRDGVANIMDIQAAIAQALRVAQETWQANVDESGQVDILDVQHLTNTVLRTGGLVQRVQGVLAFDPAAFRQMSVWAISKDGRRVQGEVNPGTGEFFLVLRVKTAWSIAFLATVGEQERPVIGTLQFPIAGNLSSVLPIPRLSRGGPLNLGHLQFGNLIRPPHDVRALLAQIAGQHEDTEANGDGIPDFAEPLLDRAQNAPGVPQRLARAALVARIAKCIEVWLDDLTIPDLSDTDENGIPDFLRPLIVCLRNNIQGWFEDHGETVPSADGNHNGTPDFIERIIEHIVEGIPAWMASLNHPELMDQNENGIPDYMEPTIGIPGGPNSVDIDGDGVPDFAQDHDGDGIPNINDEDARNPDDCDGDGVTNREDRDDDNDGVPDYADGAPCNPDGT